MVAVVLTLPVVDSPAMLESQLAFHLEAGADAIVLEGAVPDALAGDARVHTTDGPIADAARAAGADWILPARPAEFWWPRGATYDEILSRVPPEFDVVQAIARPFLRSAKDDPQKLPTYRLSAQAYVAGPDGVPSPQRRLAHRAHVDIGEYDGEIVKSALRPLRGWYPIEVLSLGADRVSEDELAQGIAEGVVQVDTRLRDALQAIHAGEHVTFARPSVVDSAAFAVDAAVLGEGDAFRLRGEFDDLERRLADLEEKLVVRVERRLRRIARRP